MKKIIFLITIVFIILNISTLTAQALARPVGGIDMTKSNWGDGLFPNNYYWTGTFANNYIMSAPTITYGHINSVYMKQEDQNFNIVNEFELGWQWLSAIDPNNPHYFVTVYENGAPLKWPNGAYYLDLGVAPKNHNGNFQVQVNNGVVYYYIDGVLVNNNPNFPNSGYLNRTAITPVGLAVWGSERQNPSSTNPNPESNYGHFWGLQKRNLGFGWGGWQNLQTYTDRDANDQYASYSYSLQKISNTEAYSTVFNYQPFYRLWNGRDHFYTMSDVERWALLFPAGGFTYEQTSCYMANSGESYSVNFYRSYNPTSGDHLYTTSSSEANTPGYSYEGVAGYVYSTQVSGSVPLYRSYQPTTGEHFYTTSWSEANTPGYTYEEVAGYVRTY